MRNNHNRDNGSVLFFPFPPSFFLSFFLLTPSNPLDRPPDKIKRDIDRASTKRCRDIGRETIFLVTKTFVFPFSTRYLLFARRATVSLSLSLSLPRRETKSVPFFRYQIPRNAWNNIIQQRALSIRRSIVSIDAPWEEAQCPPCAMSTRLEERGREEGCTREAAEQPRATAEKHWENTAKVKPISRFSIVSDQILPRLFADLERD